MADIYRTGPAPVLMHQADWRKTIDYYEEVTNGIENDESARKSMDWLREMYTFSIAATALNIPLDLQPPSTTVLISQPPSSDSRLHASMYHYTWSCEVLSTPGDLDSVLWRFDKRRITSAEESFKITQLPMPEPYMYESGNYTMWFPMKKKFEGEVAKTMVDMMTLMNKAIETLPELQPCGWHNLPECDVYGKPLTGTIWTAKTIQ